MADIFISYSRRDSERALVLVEQLRATGLSVWIDQQGLEAATSWSKEIANALQESQTVLLLLSPAAVASENVAKELSAASQLRKRIVPVILEPVELSGEFLYHLSGLQQASIDQFDSILRALGRPEGSRANGSTGSATAAQPRTTGSSKRWIKYGLLVLAAAALVIGGYSYYNSKKAPIEDSAIKTLAVLPFESLSSDKENDYFADGLTATLIDMLVPVEEIRVVDRQSSMEFKGSKQDLKSIASALKSRYIVTGTVQRQGDDIRIAAQMTDVTSGAVLFSKSFPGKTADLMGLQQQIAQTIVAELQLAFSSDGLPLSDDSRTSSPEAHELCLKADYAEEHSLIDSAITYYRQAIQLDNKFASPHLQLARLYGNKYVNGPPTSRDLIIADSFLAIGRKLDTAQTLSHFVASWLATVHGDYDRAITEATLFNKKEPRGALGYHVLGLAYFRMKQFRLAADNFAEIVKRCPISDLNRLMMLQCLWQAHDTVRLRQAAIQALPVFEASLERHPDRKELRIKSIPVALVFAGRGDDACRMMEELLKTPNVDSNDVETTAAIFAVSGRGDRAMEIIRGKIARSGVQSVEFNRPFFESIRGIPEFQAWVKQKEALTKQHG